MTVFRGDDEPLCARCHCASGWHETAGRAEGDTSCSRPGCYCAAFRDAPDERQTEMFR